MTLITTGGFQSIEFDKLLDANSLFATFLGRLTHLIFNKRRIKTQYEVSKAQQEQALFNFKQCLFEAGSEVSNALNAFNAETEKYRYRLNEVEALDGGWR